jgi:hypothetical protein
MEQTLIVPPTHTIYEELEELNTSLESDAILHEPLRDLHEEDDYDAQILAGLVSF